MSHVYYSGMKNEYKALDQINLSVRQGEFVAVIGTNGSGKSTLAKHLNAILLPSSGRCLIRGMDTREEENLWQIRQEVGMVFQNPDNQIIAAVVEEDVAFGVENLGVESSQIRTRVMEALRAVGMEHYRKFAPHLLSGGQKQRIAIARALVRKSKILLLDEATSALDLRSEQIVQVALERASKGRTTIIVAHRLSTIANADRIVLIDAGRVLEEGTHEELMARRSAYYSLVQAQQVSIDSVQNNSNVAE